MNTSESDLINKTFYPGWLMVSQLRCGQPVTDGEALYRQACRWVTEAREALTAGGVSEASAEQMLYAYCALLDESVLNRASQDDGYRRWRKDPLQARFFSTLNAGEELWERIRQLLREPTADAAVLTCFYRTLQLGFVGQYRAEDDERREDVAQALGSRVPPFSLTQEAPVANNLWQQQIAGITTLSPGNDAAPGPHPLPDLLLSSLPHRHGVSRRMRDAGLAAGVGFLFLALAMLASFINNQRLVRSVGDHLAGYHRLSGTPPTPKLQAQQRLRADSRLLDDWLRRGEPLRYRLGLYQGGRLIPFVEAAINDWAPPPPPRPVIKQVVQGPQTIRLDSMALFDTGKSTLKPGSTKLLVNSLLGIKAKPGWLIVVAGHTDSIGNDRSNQQLSLKRAEAVRDWMRDTGDVPVSCFAVQGYGASRPVASNETPEGRAQNRRVEISLVPQKDACLTPGTANTSGAETNGLKSETE